MDVLQRFLERAGRQLIRKIHAPAGKLELAERDRKGFGRCGLRRRLGCGSHWLHGLRHQRQQADASVAVTACDDFRLVHGHRAEGQLAGQGRQLVDADLHRGQLDRRAVVGMPDVHVSQADAALERHARRFAGRLSKGCLQVGRQARGRQAESFFHRQVAYVTGQVEAIELEIDHRLAGGRKRFGLAADLERRVIHLHRQKRLDKGFDLRRQVGNKGHADIKIGNHVLLPGRAVVKIDATLFDADVVDREVALRAVIRLGQHFIDDVRPVEALALKAHHAHRRLDQPEFLNHHAAAEQRFGLDVGVQRGETHRRSTAFALKNAQAAHLGRQGVRIDRHPLDRHWAVEQFADLRFGDGFDQRRRRQKTRHANHRHHAGTPQHPLQRLSASPQFLHHRSCSFFCAPLQCELFVSSKPSRGRPQ